MPGRVGTPPGPGPDGPLLCEKWWGLYRGLPHQGLAGPFLAPRQRRLWRALEENVGYPGRVGTLPGPSPDGPLLCEKSWGLYRGLPHQGLALPLPSPLSEPGPASAAGGYGMVRDGWGLYRARSGRPFPLQKPVGTLPGSSPRGAVGPPI